MHGGEVGVVIEFPIQDRHAPNLKPTLLAHSQPQHRCNDVSNITQHVKDLLWRPIEPRRLLLQTIVAELRSVHLFRPSGNLENRRGFVAGRTGLIGRQQPICRGFVEALDLAVTLEDEAKQGGTGSLTANDVGLIAHAQIPKTLFGDEPSCSGLTAGERGSFRFSHGPAMGMAGDSTGGCATAREWPPGTGTPGARRSYSPVRSALCPPKAWMVLVPARTSPACGTPRGITYSSPAFTGTRCPSMSSV